MSVLGERAYEAELGPGETRAQIAALDYRLRLPTTVDQPTSQFRKERGELILQLGNTALALQAPPAEVTEAYGNARDAQAAVVRHDAALADMRAKLAPAGNGDWVRIGIGYGTVASILFLVVLLLTGLHRNPATSVARGRSLDETVGDGRPPIAEPTPRDPGAGSEQRQPRRGQETLTLMGHTAEVVSVCFSPDGKCLASGGSGFAPNARKVWGEVKVWDAHTGQVQLTLTGHTGMVNGVCFSPDGKRIASAATGGFDQGFLPGEVRVWDAHTAQEQLTLKGHTSWVYSVCFSPDGKRLASGCDDNTVKVWFLKPAPSRDTPTEAFPTPPPEKPSAELPFTLDDLVKVLGRPDQTNDDSILYNGKIKATKTKDGIAIAFSTGNEGLFFAAGLFTSRLFTKVEGELIIDFLDEIDKEKVIGRFKVKVSKATEPLGWRQASFSAK
jgi:hypothetical protein